MTRSHVTQAGLKLIYVAKNDLELLISYRCFPKWDYRCVQSHSIYILLRIDARALYQQCPSTYFSI